jgi:hypothetical protein
VVFGLFLIKKLNRGKGHIESVLSSFFELLFDFVTGLLIQDLLPGAGTIAILMVIVGFIMMIINIVQIIVHLGG